MHHSHNLSESFQAVESQMEIAKEALLKTIGKHEYHWQVAL